MRANKYVVAAITVATLGTIVSALAVFGTSHESALDGIVRTESFKVYQPQELPRGYAVKQESAVSESGIVRYTVTTPSGSSAVITQQLRPEEIHSGSFSGLRINTPVGKATISSSPAGASAAVITASDTLILVNSTTSIKESEIKTILSSL